MRRSEKNAAPSPRRSAPLAARAWLAAAAVWAGCALPPAVTAEDPPLLEAHELAGADAGLSEEQHRRLRAGARVEELVELERQGQRYVGGVAYALVGAEPGQVFDVLNRLETLSDVLPQTRNLRVLERSDPVRVEIEQGNGVVSTRFTVFFAREPGAGEDAHLVRFWLDPSRPHGIDDVWGFFRATRYDAQRSLISVGALVDLGPGIIRMLFEQRVQRAILRMPNRIRDVVERTHGDSGASASVPSPAP